MAVANLSGLPVAGAAPGSLLFIFSQPKSSNDMNVRHTAFLEVSQTLQILPKLYVNLAIMEV